MKSFLLLPVIVPFCVLLLASTHNKATVAPSVLDGDGWQLVWNDEFDVDGLPDSTKWQFENGFARNEELQWYTNKNAICRDGILYFEARLDTFPNPTYSPTATDWRRSRELVTITSSSINTRNKFHFRYGKMEVRARIDTTSGSWPAIWTLGVEGEWPSNGEVDQMEFYRVDGVPTILANTAWGTNVRWKAAWNSERIPLSYFLDKDPKWADKFHIWTMVWDENHIRLYLDNALLNTTDLRVARNPSGRFPAEPFQQAQYILLNLAIGSNGGEPDYSRFPITYEVDYVRVYQKNIQP
jgi:beta-glucanase (GH16 family)